MIKQQDLIQCADDERSRLLLEKMEAENEKKIAQKELEDLTEVEDKITSQFKGNLEEIQVTIKHTTS